MNEVATSDMEQVRYREVSRSKCASKQMAPEKISGFSVIGKMQAWLRGIG